MSKTDLSAWHFVIVEDDPNNLAVLEAVLDHYHARVTSALSAKDALNTLNELKTVPQAIITDISMPMMDGIELLHKIKAMPFFVNATTIALTANAMPRDRDRLLDAGFDGYIAKPLNAATLMQEIVDIMRNGAARNPSMVAE